MEFAAQLPTLIATGVFASVLTLGTKLAYDGIKEKRNGGNGKAANIQNIQERIAVHLALLTKDVDFNNKILVEIKQSIDKLAEHTVMSNIHLLDLKTHVQEQMHEFRKVTSKLDKVTIQLENR